MTCQIRPIVHEHKQIKLLSICIVHIDVLFQTVVAIYCQTQHGKY
jgi:hypothetical protein